LQCNSHDTAIVLVVNSADIHCPPASCVTA